VDLDIIGLILQASLLVKLVIVMLGAMSVGSWGIIAHKYRELRRAEQDSEAFIEIYRGEPFAQTSISTAARSQPSSWPAARSSRRSASARATGGCGASRSSRSGACARC
jgi:biopolymer transport protein ExbB/TolQ